MSELTRKKFLNFEEAIGYCKEKGELRFFGRIGSRFEYAVYNLYIGNVVYHLLIKNDGLLIVEGRRMKHEGE